MPGKRVVDFLAAHYYLPHRLAQLVLQNLALLKAFK
ncbi:hypothetical protein CKO_02231 [Citrobacter koseri ATCC BAA-895]|uniref:Uncharacterized protein n=1 Tax=Citrobacter koseri (strain ATCC BAA-895 / CDC 4225-83 / SGSC4696) TaxID=290338 RepID=A8AIP0_CITK8|nr:hypothetical protein CKO_02231 [Citrobacter koseri ATCC BAA-895]